MTNHTMQQDRAHHQPQTAGRLPGTGRDPLAPHSHEPNPSPPGNDSTVHIWTPGAPASVRFPLARLQALPPHSVQDCFIVSTGHGTSGPFHFRGPLLSTLAAACGVARFAQVAIISGDGFGTRLTAQEVLADPAQGPVLLALWRDGTPLTRQQGLVRLIVPAETDDALKQIKWVAQIQFTA